MDRPEAVKVLRTHAQRHYGELRYEKITLVPLIRGAILASTDETDGTESGYEVVNTAIEALLAPEGSVAETGSELFIGRDGTLSKLGSPEAAGPLADAQ